MGFLVRFLSILADILSGPGVLLFGNFNMIFLTSTGEKEIGNLLVSQCSVMSEAFQFLAVSGRVCGRLLGELVQTFVQDLLLFRDLYIEWCCLMCLEG